MDGPARPLPPPARADRELRPRAGRPGRRARRRRRRARRPRRRRARGVARRRPAPDERHRSRAVPRGRGARHPLRDHRDGQGRRPRAQLRQRRRRHLRRRGRRGGRRLVRARGRHRDPARDADDARHRRARRRAGPVGGRPEPPAGGQGRRARAHPRVAPRLLRPLGEGLGVPGAAEGAAARRRPRARRALRRGARAQGLERARRARTSSSRCSGCASASPTTSRTTRCDYQLKLGPGGLRDVEFTVQLLQLVHGQTDDRGAAARTRSPPSPRSPRRATSGGTRRPSSPATTACSACSSTASSCATCAAPTSCRATRATCASWPGRPVSHRAPTQLLERWNAIKHRVRGLHERLFYRPLLSAVAALPERRTQPHQRAGRGAAGGHRLPRPAGRARPHRRADRRGLAAGDHPAAPAPGDAAVVRRRRRPRLRSAHLPAAERRPRLDALVPPDAARLVRSRRAADPRALRARGSSGELLGRIPESVAWLESEDELRPRSAAAAARGDRARSSRATMRRMPRPPRCAPRAVARCCGWRSPAILGFCTVEELAHGLTDVTENVIAGRAGGDPVRPRRSATARVRRHRDGAVRRPRARLRLRRRRHVRLPAAGGDDQDAAHTRARRPSSRELNRLTEDNRLPLDLDIGLRPEGKNGAVGALARVATARTTSAGRSPGRRRRCCARAASPATRRCSPTSRRSPTRCATPRRSREQEVREVKRIKARVENERLPQGADPARHLKLGPRLAERRRVVRAAASSCSTPRAFPALRTTSTLEALAVAADERLGDRRRMPRKLRDAWIFASRARSAMTLWTEQDRRRAARPTASQLDGVARLLEYPPGSASRARGGLPRASRAARAPSSSGRSTGERERPAPTTG